MLFFVLWFAHRYIALIEDINRKLREDAEREIDQHGGHLMILTFLLRRRSAIKVLGSVIDAALARGHRCFIAKRPEVKDQFVLGDFDRWLGKLHPTHRLIGRVIGVATDADAHVGVSQFFDNILTGPGAEVQCYLSQWHKDLHMSVAPDRRWWIKDQPVTGWTVADHRALLALKPGGWIMVYDPRRYDLLFTMKRRVPEPWRRSIKGRAWYFEKIYGAWHSAKEEGASLVIKTRPKHGDPWWLSRFGRVVGEDTMYPSTSLELMRMADRVIHFMSGAHAEARMMGVEVLNYRVPQPHLDHLPGQRDIYEALVHDPTLFRDEYMTKFFTYDDTRAGERVVDVVEHA